MGVRRKAATEKQRAWNDRVNATIAGEVRRRAPAPAAVPAPRAASWWLGLERQAFQATIEQKRQDGYWTQEAVSKTQNGRKL